MADDETWTIGRLLEWTKEYLQKNGSDTARLDAEVLLAHAKECQRIELYTAFDEIASNELRTSFRNLVKQRAAGMPVAYLVGSREFYSLPFAVTPAVLIPRPETEFLVIRLLDLAREYTPGEPLHVADIGTGSGILAICAALYLRENCRIEAVDISHEALSIAQQNADTHGVSEKISFTHGDLLNKFEAGPQFDFVVSNPPYVSEEEFDELDAQVRDYEPSQALVGGPTGTEVIQELVEQAASRLKANGWLILEVSPMICDRVEQLLRATDKFENVKVTDDLAKLPRIIEASKRGS